nr:fimbrillin family protein [Bacteroidales bacterium]
MHKHFLLYMTAAATLLATVGCDKQAAPDTADAITIEASVGPMTKVAYEGNEARFTTGDQIALYGWLGTPSEIPAERVANGIVYAFDGKQWTAATLIRWKNRTDAHYFLGVSPALAAGTDPTAVPYTLDPADQAAGDLLVATNLGGVKATDGPVALTFDHTMAKLNVNLKFRSQWTTTPTVSSVKLVAKTAATVN